MQPIAETKEDVVKRIAAARDALREKGVLRLGLFGSFARATPSPLSDVDLLVEFQPGRLSFDAFMDVHFLLEDLLGRRIELVTPNALSRHIGPHIAREVEDVLFAA